MTKPVVLRGHRSRARSRVDSTSAGTVKSATAPHARADEVVVVVAGEVLGELVAGEVVGAVDAVDDAVLLEDGEVA